MNNNVEKRNKILCVVFGVLEHLTGWVALLIYAGIKYGVYLKEVNKIVLLFIFASVLGVWFLFKSLKEVSETGYAMSRQVARALRFIIPMVFVFGIVTVLDKNLGGIVDLLQFFTVGVIVSRVFNVLSYRFSKRYIRDTGINTLVNKSK